MITVCIPVYNQFVTKLISDLHFQLLSDSDDFEILVFDDGSLDTFKQKNREITKFNNLVYKELPENIGRSKIRNLLANNASKEYLLFIDCDSTIINSNFIANYKSILPSNYSVVCGGSIYPPTNSDKNKMLRWKNGTYAEYIPADLRVKNPSASFMTNNFIIKKNLFKIVRFNEELSQYGHEDTFFGYELLKNNIVPFHIENPVLNGALDENPVFIKKTKQAIENLSSLYNKMKKDDQFINQVSLLKFYHQLKFKWILILFYPFITILFKVLLRLGVISLSLFKLYKLTYFAKTNLLAPKAIL